jgi:hypothetical protein
MLRRADAEATGGWHAQVEQTVTVDPADLDATIRILGSTGLVERVRAVLQLLATSPVGQRMLAALRLAATSWSSSRTPPRRHR